MGFWSEADVGWTSKVQIGPTQDGRRLPMLDPTWIRHPAKMETCVMSGAYIGTTLELHWLPGSCRLPA